MEDQERVDTPQDEDVEAHGRKTLRQGEEPRDEAETDDDVELHGRRTVR